MAYKAMLILHLFWSLKALVNIIEGQQIIKMTLFCAQRLGRHEQTV